MIKNIQLKFGASPDAPPLALDDPAVTIFVGPNNSGKSLALREIAEVCQTGQVKPVFLIVGEFTFSDPEADFGSRELERLKVQPTLQDNVPPDHSLLSIQGNRFSIPTITFIGALEAPNAHKNQFAAWWLRFQTLILDGPNRIQLVNPQNRGKLLEPNSSFQCLFTDDKKREELRDILHDAFGLYFTMDASEGDQLSISFSQTKPIHNERALTDDVLEYLRAATPIQEFSDGVKAFTGILTQIHAGEPHIVLIDEPEAFLHPSLVFKLGKEISKATRDAGKTLFAATHSPQFVMGAVQSGAPVNIVRLTHTAGSSTARLLPNEELVKLLRNPLLRSVGVISALFYDHVVITEGDSDRAFYHEINERLLSFQPERGIPNTLFLNAQNKNTIPSIVEPLRKLGIPTAGIVDIDVLKDGGREWSKHLNAASIPNIEHEALANVRGKLWQALEATGQNPKREGGIDLLPDDHKEAANNLFDKLRQYGYFVVGGGELEAWLPDLRAPSEKSRWLANVFEKMGEDSESPDFLKPKEGDVWDFIASIRAWLIDKDRKGIPTG